MAGLQNHRLRITSPSYGGGREGESLMRDSEKTKIMISTGSDSETGAFPLPARMTGEEEEGAMGEGERRIADTLLTKKCRNPPRSSRLPGVESLQVRSGPV